MSESELLVLMWSKYFVGIAQLKRLIGSELDICVASGIEGFHSRHLHTKVDCFEGVATQENSDSDSKQLFA